MPSLGESVQLWSQLRRPGQLTSQHRAASGYLKSAGRDMQGPHEENSAARPSLKPTETLALAAPTNLDDLMLITQHNTSMPLFASHRGSQLVLSGRHQKFCGPPPARTFGWQERTTLGSLLCSSMLKRSGIGPVRCEKHDDPFFHDG